MGSALESSDAGVEAIKAWAVDKLPEGPTLYPKVSLCACVCLTAAAVAWVGSVCVGRRKWAQAVVLCPVLQLTSCCAVLCCGSALQSMVSEQPERFFVSEIIREQIFVQYDQEIPYACQVSKGRCSLQAECLIGGRSVSVCEAHMLSNSLYDSVQLPQLLADTA